MIQTKVRVSHRSGLNLLIEPKHTTSPKGNDSTSVAAKSNTVVPKPSSRRSVICSKVISVLCYKRAGKAVFLRYAQKLAVVVEGLDCLVDLR